MKTFRRCLLILFVLAFVLFGCKTKYTISFDANNGTTITQVLITKGTRPELPEEPVKEGYTFKGWYLEGNVYDFSDGVKEDITLIAKWEVNEYTLTIKYEDGVSEDKVEKIKFGDAISLTNPTREGYNFVGWDKQIPTKMPANDLTVSAKWSIGKYTLTVKYEDGETPDSVTEYNYGEAISLENPTREGYSFVGWDKDVPTTMPAENLVITAKWTVGKYKFTVKYADGKTEDSVTEYDFGENVVVENPTRDGYTFTGWDKEVPATMPNRDVTIIATWGVGKYKFTIKYADGVTQDSVTEYDFGENVVVSEPSRTGYTFKGWDKEVPTTMPNKDVTIVATWDAIKYDITYVLNGGSITSNPTFYTIEDEITLPTPVKTGYTFAGWSDNGKIAKGTTGAKTFTTSWTANTYVITYDVNGGDALESSTLNVVFDDEYILVIPTRYGYTFAGWYASDAKVENGVWKSDSNITLSASWVAISYQITFVLNGGTLSTSVDSYTIEDEITLPSPAKKGYTFAGWEEGEKIEVGTTGAKTFTAKWTANTYAITYDVNGGDVLESSTQDATYDSEYVLITPTKSGYSFDGWYAGDEKIEEGVWTSDAGISLQAHWSANTYRVKVIGDGGTVNVAFNLNGAEGEIDSQEITSTNGLVYPTIPRREGYVFAGWYDNEACEGDVFAFNEDIAENVTLYAKWASYAAKATAGLSIGENTINIRGGSSSTGGTQYFAFMPLTSGRVTINVGKSAWIGYSSVAPTATSTSAYDSTSAYNTITATVTAGTMYYISLQSYKCNTSAEYVGSTYLNIINATPEAGAKSAGLLEVVFDSAFELPVKEKFGYTFVGWGDSEGTIYTDNQGKSIVNWDKAYNTSLYPVFAPITSTITYDVNGGDELTSNTQTVGYEQAYRLVVPTKAGYSFEGWFDSEGNQVLDGTWMSFEDLTLTAHWSIIIYTIEYVTGNGSSMDPAPSTYTVNDEEITLPTPTRLGYEFVEWNDEGKIPHGSTGNKVFTAVWEANTYTVTYDVNTGDELESDTQEIAYDSTYELAIPTKTGYTFTGWYDSEGNIVENGTWTRLVDLDLTASWTITIYHLDFRQISGAAVVSFDLNGAEGEVASQMVDETNVLAYPAIPTRSGYIFAGWYEDEECSGTPYDFSAEVDADVTLYAKWASYSELATAIILGENTINIIGGGGNAGTQFFAFAALTTETVTVNVGKSAYIACSSSTPTLGKNFANGKYNSNTIAVTAGNVYYISLQSYYNNTDSSHVGSAYLNVISSLPLDGGIGTGSHYIMDITYGSTFIAPIPAIVGYNFLGWYDGEDGTGTLYADADGNCVTSWVDLRDMTLYPKLEAIVSTITLDVDGGDELDVVSFDIAYDDELDLPTPTKYGYTFVGWFDGETQIDGIWHGLTDATLTAHWVEYSITISGGDITAIDCDALIDNEVFNAKAVDTDGDEIEIVFTLLSDTKEAGDIISVLLTASGKYDISATKTVENIKVYGDSTISYNEERDYINVGELDTIADALTAAAKDTFDVDLTVTGAIKEEEYEAGDLVTIVLTTINAAGRVNTLEIEGIKFYDLPIISHSEKADMKDTETVSADLFGVSAVDSFGEDVDVVVTTSNAITAGNTITVVCTATDSKGNVNVLRFSVKVYGIPSLGAITAGGVKETDEITVALLGITARDSFGVLIPSENITIESVEGDMEAGNTLIVVAKAVDHLGNENTRTYTGVKVYGAPVITFDDTREVMKYTDIVNAEYFTASALSTFDENLRIVISLYESEFAGGNTVRFALSATDVAGNTTTVITSGIKVYSANTITINFESIEGANVKKASNGEEYSATATDSFGGSCTVTLVLSDGRALVGGITADVRIVATDFLGNVATSELIEDANIYDMPTLEYENETYYIFSEEDPADKFTLVDSFGEEVEFALEVVADSSTDRLTVCHITGSDAAGNAFDATCTLDVVGANETAVHVYINGEEIIVTYLEDTLEYVLPRYTGYTVTWTVNGVEVGNDSLETVTLELDENASSIRAHGAKVANTYNVTLDGLAVIVSFDLNGAEGEVESQRVDETHGLVYPTIPTRSGYVFAGWYTSADCTGNAFNFSQNIEADITLYAKWIEPTSYVSIINVGESRSVSLSGTTIRCYPFVPLTSGSVTIYSSGSYDTYGYLYNASKSQLTSNDDGGSGSNFQITYNVTAGTLYYIGVRAYSSSTTGNVTLYLTGAATPAAGGILSGLGRSVTLTYDAPFTIPVLSKTGYTFEGWFDGEDGTGVQYADSEGNSVINWNKASDSILYAKWEAIPSTITFDANGGTSETATMDVEYDEDVTLPTPVRLGYEFTGWFDSEDNLVESGIWLGVEDLTLTAHWSIIVYTIEYVTGNGSSMDPAPLTYTVEDEEIVLPTPSRIGYEFTSWNDEGKVPHGSTGNKVFTAVWEANTYTVTYDVNTGDELESDTQVIAYDSEYELAVPTKAGYRFTGWYNGLTKYEDGVWTLTHDLELTANWEIIYYEINLGTSTVTVTYGSTYTLPSYTREGYTFLGWYDGIGGTGVQYTDNEGNCLHAWSDLEDKRLYQKWEGAINVITLDVNGGNELDEDTINVGYYQALDLPTPTKTGYTFTGWYIGEVRYENDVWTGESDTTLTAHWEVNQYTITLIAEVTDVIVSFNLNGAEGEVASQTIDKTNGLVYPTIPTRSGYVFAGWYANSACSGTPFDFTQAIYNDVTLYAKWIEPTSYASIIYVGQSRSVSLSGTNIRYYPFVPLTSGSVTMYTSSSYDTYGYLYNASKSQLAYNDDGGSGTNFQITYNVTAGTLYYIGVRAYSSSTTGNATLYLTGTATPAAGGLVEDINRTITVNYGDTFDLLAPRSRGVAFRGWYDNEECTGNPYTDSEGHSLSAWTYLEDKTLYPKWEVVITTITFDVADGNALDEATMSATYGREVTLPVPTKTGCTFVGWYDGVTKYESGEWRSIDDITLTAHWEYSTYNVTLNAECDYAIVSFNLNGAEGEVARQEIDGDTGLVYPAIPTRDGYLFAGWYENAECTGTPFDFSQNVNHNVTLYAKWATYSASANAIVCGNNTINIIGGSGSAGTQFFAFVPLVSERITIDVGKEAYIGCSSSIPSGSTYSGSGYNTISTSVTAGTVYYISLQSNGCSTSASYIGSTYLNVAVSTPTAGGVAGRVDSAVAQVTYNSTYTLLVPTMSGVAFAGWYDNEECEGNPYTDNEGHSLSAWTYLEDKTLYPKWEVITTTITFDVNGGDALENSTMAANYNSSVTLPTPTKAGSTFTGWYNGETKYESGAWVSRSDITLTAHWEYNTYTVTLNAEFNFATVSFDLNGAEGEIASQEVGGDTTLVYPAIPTRDGYLFAGWYENAECSGTPFDFSAEVNTNVTLYAKWVAHAGTPLTLNTSVTIAVPSSSSDFAYYAFIPLVTGTLTYSGGSNGSYNIDLCNASQEAIAFHDTLGSSYNVTAGTLYYLRYRSTGSAFNLSITTSVVRLTPLDGGINSGVDRQFMDVTYNSSYTLLVPTRDGYVFAGWYDNEECEGDPYTNALGQSINNWTGLEDKDLYPKWEIE